VPPASAYLHTPHPSARLLPRIACAIKILFQISSLIMVHSQVCTLPALW
jgi:hypothetical protein